MKTRKVAAAVLAAGMVAGLAACSAPADDGNVELVVWDTGLLGRTNEDGSAADDSFLDNMARKFEKENPGVTITTVQQGGDISTNSAQFQAASIAGNGPDIRIQYPGGPTLSYEDFYTDLTPLIPQSTIDSMSGFATTRAGYDPNGAILGMPYGSGLYFVVFQNIEMVEAAGLDPNDTPKTWEEMLANGQTMLDTTGQVPFWAANLEGYVGAWAVGALLGGELGETAATEMYNGDLPVNNDSVLKVYQAWADFGSSGLVNPDAGQTSNGESIAGFIQGRGAYYLVGSWENAGLLEAMGDNVSSFFIPMLEGAKYPNTAAGGPQIAISITNYSKHQDVAAEFLNFLALPENQDEYVRIYQTEGSNNVNSDPSVIENRLLQEQIEQLKNYDTVVYPFDNVMPQAVIDLFYRVNSSTFNGTQTPQEAADQLEAANQAELAAR